jgi:hypothetical protein
MLFASSVITRVQFGEVKEVHFFDQADVENNRQFLASLFLIHANVLEH